MKLNGALEPHQGASVQRSSTGVVAIASKYREQRYPYQNVDVVKDVNFTRNAVGVDKMQQQQQQQQHQSCASYVKIISKKLESSKATCSGSNDKSNNNNNNNKKKKKNNNNTNNNEENNSNVNRFTNIDYNSHGNRGRRTHQKQIKQQQIRREEQQTLIDVNIETRLLHQSLVKVVTLEASSRYSPSLQTAAAKRVVIGNNLVRNPDSSQLSMFLWQTIIILWPFLSTFDVSAKVIKVMRASRGFNCLRSGNIWPKSDKMLTLCLLYAAAFTLPQLAVANDDDHFFGVNSFSMAPEATTTEFDYASRGQKKFGDKCENTLECGFPGSICDPKKKSCQCTEDLPVTNHIDKCGKEAAVNESCFFNEQCEAKYFQTECRDGRCVCRFEMTPFWLKDGSVECKAGRQDKKTPEVYVDWAMIGVLIGMALMFIIICVVLRLFSQARWHENRTIFNTPNPRLMNVSLLRESKLLHGQERRGSRMSVRGPSRQPSMASLRPHSPNPSLGKTGRMIRSKSNTRSSDSRVSDTSNCSRLIEHSHATNMHQTSHATNLTHVIHPHNSATVSPLSTHNVVATGNAGTVPNTTTTTYVSQIPLAGTTACSTPLSTPPPSVANKTNKF
ncbi:uncharacterized protein LOC119634956 isoform X1 [Glossina fuscipes]|uniref:Uncharacterized protein LOC119634956 isoform X1 n=1 Tax=Glossina fuscipes TaxID=7396 RepID=A0A8U0WKA4_9MUSC|nr:uncharacterized protein LOC119634956 isoform X1 [Glossina fuscipes]KAI9584753.1 hypothetical protein GQX74_006648 [Glossina fuscipes]